MSCIFSFQEHLKRLTQNGKKKKKNQKNYNIASQVLVLVRLPLERCVLYITVMNTYDMSLICLPDADGIVKLTSVCAASPVWLLRFSKRRRVPLKPVCVQACMWRSAG